jgi:hypothetical protein
MLTGIFAVILLAMVLLGWALDRRAALRREDDAMQDGIFLGRTLGKLSEEAKSEMFADVMASHHERNGYVEKKWNRYTVGMLAFAVTCMVLAGLVWWSL